MSRCSNCKEVHKETTEVLCIRHYYNSVTPIKWARDRFGNCEASYSYVPCFHCWNESFAHTNEKLAKDKSA